jgi:ribonuclease P protein component
VGNKFPFDCRLHHSYEFDLVFKSSRLATKWFTLYYLKNNKNCPRIGLIVSKKLVHSAVCRNKIKRIARESFRNLAADLSAIDFIIRINKTIKNREDSDAFSQLLSCKLSSFPQIKKDESNYS